MPYTSYYADLPPAGSRGGPTRPCPPRVDWGESTPLPPGQGRAGRPAGEECKDFEAVRYPVCSPEQVARAVRVDAFVMPETSPGDKYGGPLIAVRGFLRRDAAGKDADWWQFRLEALAADGTCAEVGPDAWPRGSDKGPPAPYETTGTLCRGDASVSCCVSAVVDADVEVVYESGNGAQMCLVRSSVLQGAVHAVRRDAERGIQRPQRPHHTF